MPKASIDTLWIHYAEAADRRDPVLFESIFTETPHSSFNMATASGQAAVQEFLSLYASVDDQRGRPGGRAVDEFAAQAGRSGRFTEEERRRSSRDATRCWPSRGDNLAHPPARRSRGLDRDPNRTP
jgi:hypothetical protein